MNSLPLTWGAVLSTSPGRAPRLTVAGEPIDVQLGTGRHRLTGVASGPYANAEVTHDGAAGLLLIGEVHDGDERLSAAGVMSTWRRYGIAAFRLLHGRFAVVLLDGPRLVLVTDHVGSIPLVIAVKDDWVEIATEIKVITAQHGRADLPGTYAAIGAPTIRRLCAGTLLHLNLESGRAEAHRTWQIPSFRERVPPSSAVQQTRVLLERAIQRCLGQDAVSVVLSGGIDSSGVAAVASVLSPAPVTSVSMGTDAGDEFDHSRLVADYVGTVHHELHVSSTDVIDALPRTIALAESTDAEILEYLLPLVVLYEQIASGPRRVLTGYGADIPLGGMHRDEHDLAGLDHRIAHDLATFDGLGEITPLIGGHVGLWTTHPYWDRDLLQRLTTFEPGLKRRDGIDKWVLRQACSDLLPRATVRRAKLGIHEGSGTTSTWTAMLSELDVPGVDIPQTKHAIAKALYHEVVLGRSDPKEIDLHEYMVQGAQRQRLAAS